MKINIEVTELLRKTIEEDIDFPYYGWWDDKKNSIIKENFSILAP